MADPNIVGHIELTCAGCGFTGTPIVSAAHDCADFLRDSKERSYQGYCGNCGQPTDTLPCPHCEGRHIDSEKRTK